MKLPLKIRSPVRPLKAPPLTTPQQALSTEGFQALKRTRYRLQLREWNRQRVLPTLPNCIRPNQKFCSRRTVMLSQIPLPKLKRSIYLWAQGPLNRSIPPPKRFFAMLFQKHLSEPDQPIASFISSRLRVHLTPILRPESIHLPWNPSLQPNPLLKPKAKIKVCQSVSKRR